MTTIRPNSLLLDICVPFRVVNGKLAVESQAHNGLYRWLDNFEFLTVCAPVLPAESSDDSTTWADPESLIAEGRLALVPFPWGYRPYAHASSVGDVRRQLRELIPRHQYLCFANLGWLGAWGSVAAQTAHELRRPYSVWLDWVLHNMPREIQLNTARRAWHALQHHMISRNSIRDIRRASLGLFHGRTVFEGYAGLPRVSKIVHDIHLTAADAVLRERLKMRLQRAQTPLQILYVGRVHESKGPRQWLDAVEVFFKRYSGGRGVRARWVGDGPLLDEMRKEVTRRNLGDRVTFSGTETDRAKLMEIYREADLFAFCHVTPESPRCLIEALMSGLPIIGFDSAYAVDLLGGRPGGAFVPIGDSPALAALLLTVAQSPQQRADMSIAAHDAGLEFSDEKVFAHRSELIKQNLPPKDRHE